MNTQPVFVLGAQDPEMRAIERVLSASGISFGHAAVQHRRCNSSSAYDADSVVLVGNDGVHRQFLLRPTQDVAFVECGVRGHNPVLHIDHHNPGDPGFGVEPANYMKGSSLGQVLAYCEIKPTEDHRLLCAADHCLTAAYQNQCPGVDPDELLFMRSAWQAKMTYRTLGDTMTSILEAAKQVKARYDNKVGAAIFPDPTRMPADLPEGAAYAGYPVRYRSLSLDGTLKEMLKGGSTDQIQQFMDEHQQLGRKVYGNPYRGYAGAYLT